MKKKKKAKKTVKKKRACKKKVCKKAKKKVVKRKAKETQKVKAKKKKTSIPEGASLEEIGIVTHYFPHVEAAVVKMTKSSLSLGDTIILKGHTTDFKEKVNSIQLDRVPITSASIGQEIGLKVKKKVRDRDVVYKIVG